MKKSQNGALAAEGEKVENLVDKKLKFDYSENYTRVYSNVARAANNEHDVCLDFGIFGPPQEVTENPEAALIIRAVGQVYVPHGMIPSLIRILFKNLTEEEKVESMQAIEGEGIPEGWQDNGTSSDN